MSTYSPPPPFLYKRKNSAASLLSSNSLATNTTNFTNTSINTFFGRIQRGDYADQPFGSILESDDDSEISAVSQLRYRNVGDFVTDVGKIKRRHQRRLEVLKRLDKKTRSKKKKNPIMRFFSYLSKKLGEKKTKTTKVSNFSSPSKISICVSQG